MKTKDTVNIKGVTEVKSVQNLIIPTLVLILIIPLYVLTILYCITLSEINYDLHQHIKIYC